MYIHSTLYFKFARLHSGPNFNVIFCQVKIIIIHSPYSSQISVWMSTCRYLAASVDIYAMWHLRGSLDESTSFSLLIQWFQVVWQLRCLLHAVVFVETFITAEICIIILFVKYQINLNCVCANFPCKIIHPLCLFLSFDRRSCANG